MLTSKQLLPPEHSEQETQCLEEQLPSVPLLLLSTSPDPPSDFLNVGFLYDINIIKNNFFQRKHPNRAS